MAKTVKLLVIDIEGEVTILNEASQAAAELTEDAVRECYGDLAYWLTLELKDATFADQQNVTRQAAGDDALVPQKRFVAAVEKWTKKYPTQDSTSILAVSEEAFAALKPPALGNAVNVAILEAWYPGASKAADFMRAWQKKQQALELEKKSIPSPSTPAS